MELHICKFCKNAIKISVLLIFFMFYFMMFIGCSKNYDNKTKSDLSIDVCVDYDIPDTTDLRVEMLKLPYGINTKNPAFSWKMQDNDYNEKQTAYRIVIFDRLLDFDRGNFIKDTGWVESGNSTYVKIPDVEKLLKDNELYFWSVAVQDKDGHIGLFSTPQAFTTDVGGEWVSKRGIWCSPRTDKGEKGNFTFVRGSFLLQTTDIIEKAILNITAKSPEEARQYVYMTYVNGDFIGAGPVRYDIKGEQNVLYYNSFDITSYLENGKNILSAINYSTAGQSFLAQITVFYKDGTKETITNSGDKRFVWKVKDGTAAYGENDNTIAFGYYQAPAQNINGEEYPSGWNECAYDDSFWDNPTYKEVIDRDMLLLPYDADNMHEYPVIPKSITRDKNGNYLVDFGNEIIGAFGMSMNNINKTKVTIQYGEYLNDGVPDMYTENNEYIEQWTFAAGGGFLRNTTMMAYRYVFIEGCPVELTSDMLRGYALRQEFSDNSSDFTSSDELLNSIYDLTKYTIKATNQDLMVDSQSRERRAYEGDILINILSSYAFEDDYTLPRFSNEWLITHRTWPVEYTYYSSIILWNDYLYTGNADSLYEYYDILIGVDYERTLYLDSYDQNLQLLGFDKNVLFDWPENERDGYDEKDIYFNTVVNAVAIGSFEALSKIANTIGKTGDAKKWNTLAENMKNAMIQYMYNSQKGAFCDGLDANGKRIEHYSQHATVYALAFGIYNCPEMMSALLDALKSYNGEIRMSVYGTFFLLDGLYSSGNGGIAKDFLLSQGTRSWYHMIHGLGATITTEAWDPTIKGNMTFSHPWGSAPASQIVRGIFGIKPLEAGFEKYQIQIQYEGFDYASIKTPTVKGSIEVGFRLNPDGLIVTLSLPTNADSIIKIPAQKDSILIINGKKKQFVFDGINLVFELGSGKYEVLIKNNQ